MKKILVTGSGGLIGSEAANFYLKRKYTVIGIDNNMRSKFFGEQGNVTSVINNISKNKKYIHEFADIRNFELMCEIIKKHKPGAIIHCAAQPSHDKAAEIPILDFDVNARGTLNLLEATRKFAKDACFIHVSTNKVYGDLPNTLQLKESELRYDFAETKYKNGISETFSIDQSKHSLFGASKVAGDIIAQEYGRYFDMNVGIFRGGCLTGPQHAGVELHGFLSYIIKCAMSGKKYTIFGYKGKQVRDQIHCYDVINAFDHFIDNPKKGEVYNLGGGKENSASISEIIQKIKDLSGLKLNYTYSEKNRPGDHICYYTDMSKFKKDYPLWCKKYNLESIIQEIIEVQKTK